MHSFFQQAKPLLRRLGRSPMFTALTLLTLAVGIGANTAIFSIVNGVLIKPLAYPDAGRLVGVWQKAPGLPGLNDLNASPSTYFTYREEGRTFEDIGLWQNDSFSVTGMGDAEQVDGLSVTDGLLPLLGIQPVHGRWFSRRDDTPGGPDTLMISFGYWQRKFGGDPSVIGRRIVVDGKAREIIGIMPAGFRFMNQPFAMILPLQLDRSKAIIGNFSYTAAARLKPGVTLAQANADVARMIPIMLRKFAPAPGMSLQMIEQARIGPNVRPLKVDVIGDVGKILWVLMATVGVVLFIACANVANLMLVRADSRRHELAIRAALGAGWSRIAAELLGESVALGIAGGALGVGLAYGALRFLAAIGPNSLPRRDEIAIDPTVLLFTFAISLAAGLLFGLIPVFKYVGPRLNNALRQGGRNASEGREHHRARGVLVVVQVSLALVLLVGSGLMIRTMLALQHVQPGFTQPEQILTMRVYVPDAQIPKPEDVVRTYNAMADKVAAIPGVTTVGLTNSVTMDGNHDNDPLFAADKVYADSTIPPLRRYKFIAPGYFRAMGNPMLAGRELTWADILEGRPFVMVSATLARELWQTPLAAIGKQVRETHGAPWREVIGVVGDERDNGVNMKAPGIVYFPMMIKNLWGMPINVYRGQAFVIRSRRAASAGFSNEVRQAIWSVNANLPVAGVRTVREIYNASLAQTSFTLVMLAVAAGMALLLGIIGIYGVISYAVSQRTREIGIRIALGAPQRSVRHMFVRQGLVLTAIGLACGLAAAGMLTRLMQALLFEVSPLDPLTYGAVSAVLAAAAMLASYVPARRATTIEPVEALRVE